MQYRALAKALVLNKPAYALFCFDKCTSFDFLRQLLFKILFRYVALSDKSSFREVAKMLIKATHITHLRPVVNCLSQCNKCHLLNTIQPYFEEGYDLWNANKLLQSEFLKSYMPLRFKSKDAVWNYKRAMIMDSTEAFYWFFKLPDKTIVTHNPLALLCYEKMNDDIFLLRRVALQLTQRKDLSVLKFKKHEAQSTDMLALSKQIVPFELRVRFWFGEHAQRVKTLLRQKKTFVTFANNDLEPDEEIAAFCIKC